MSVAIEREREEQFLEVSSEELSKYGWELYSRTDGNVFKVLIKEGRDLQKALSNGGLYARHQLKSIDGRDLLPDCHIDFLYKGKLQEQEIMSTEYNPSIDHIDLIVLIKKS